MATTQSIKFPFIMAAERHYRGRQAPWICTDEQHLFRCVEDLDLDRDASASDALDALTSDLKSWQIYNAADFVHGEHGMLYYTEHALWMVGPYSIPGELVRELYTLADIPEEEADRMEGWRRHPVSA